MKLGLFFAAFLLSMGASAYSEVGLNNCQETPFDRNLAQCECQTYDLADPHKYPTGEVMTSCMNLACEQFRQNQQPDECTADMRGVTCSMGHVDLFPEVCPLAFPRLSRNLAPNAQAFCTSAVDKINQLGDQTVLYSLIMTNPLCVPTGYGVAPTGNWELKKVREGWN